MPSRVLPKQMGSTLLLQVGRFIAELALEVAHEIHRHLTHDLECDARGRGFSEEINRLIRRCVRDYLAQDKDEQAKHFMCRASWTGHADSTRCGFTSGELLCLSCPHLPSVQRLHKSFNASSSKPLSTRSCSVKKRFLLRPLPLSQSSFRPTNEHPTPSYSSSILAVIFLWPDHGTSNFCGCVKE